MTVVAPVLERPNRLVELLDEAFSDARLGDVVGSDAVFSRWWHETMYTPLRDFLSRPGKEFRARLTEIGFRVVAPAVPVPDPLTLLSEVLHAGSLIVDDIEDEAHIRRGGAALHRRYGVANALNAGNWLYFWADELVGRLGLEASRELEVRRRIGATLLACHYGQGLDLGIEVGRLPQHEVPAFVRTATELKTGRLMGLAAGLGARVGGGDERTVAALERFGRGVGVGLQMLDDFGGIMSDRRAHKGDEDLVRARPTWAFAWLAARRAPADYSELVALVDRVRRGELAPEILRLRLKSELGEVGKALVRNHLTRTFDGLTEVLGLSHELGELFAEIQRLERSYD